MFSEILLWTEEVESSCGTRKTTDKHSKNNVQSLRCANAAHWYIQSDVSLMENIIIPCTKKINKSRSTYFGLWRKDVCDALKAQLCIQLRAGYED